MLKKLADLPQNDFMKFKKASIGMYHKCKSELEGGSHTLGECGDIAKGLRVEVRKANKGSKQFTPELKSKISQLKSACSGGGGGSSEEEGEEAGDEIIYF